MIAVLQKIKTVNVDRAAVKKAHKEIIITVHQTQVSYNENGEEIKRRIPVKINITRMVNENAKVIKQEKAQELLNELEKIYSK